MNKYQTMVHEFHKATDSTISHHPTMTDPELRAKLIMEEAVETVAALGFHVEASIYPPEGKGCEVHNFTKSYDEPDMEDAIDGFCDLLYVVFGSAVSMGIDLDPFFAEVHRANMNKLTGPKRADGKQLKPIGWRGPDHKAILATM